MKLWTLMSVSYRLFFTEKFCIYEKKSLTKAGNENLGQNKITVMITLTKVGCLSCMLMISCYSWMRFSIYQRFIINRRDGKRKPSVINRGTLTMHDIRRCEIWDIVDIIKNMMVQNRYKQMYDEKIYNCHISSRASYVTTARRVLELI